MDTLFKILFIPFAVSVITMFITCIVMRFNKKDLLSCQIGQWSTILSVSFGCFLLAYLLVGLDPFVPDSYEFSNKEYKLDYKITTVNDQTDTTYVLTRID